jgi:hypothetical protein
MKKVLVLLAMVVFAISCKPETDVEQTASEYESITQDQFATDKDDVPSGGDKGGNG